MGYTTRYELAIDSQNSLEIIGNLRREVDYAETAIDENGDTQEECKWYNHEKDMKGFSKNYPELLFTLKGEGEEYPDIWTKYFMNGKMQRVDAVISFDQFDKDKLE